MKKKTKNLILIGGAALLAIWILKRKATIAPIRPIVLPVDYVDPTPVSTLPADVSGYHATV